jgi:CRISPR-associated protein Csm4
MAPAGAATELTVLRLLPRGAFRFGERGLGYEQASEHVHADAVFAALCAAWECLYGEDALRGQLLLERGGASPPFLISSGFPFAGPVRFYPRPFIPPPPDLALPEEVKDVRWVSEAVLGRWLGKGGVSKPVRLHDGAVLATEEEVGEIARALGYSDVSSLWLWKVSVVPRVALDARTSASSLWHFGRLVLREGCGIFLVVRFLDPRVSDRFLPAVRLLGDMGLGGERSSGYGLFDVAGSGEVPEWMRPSPSERFLTLAPVFPRRDEVKRLLADGCRYRLLARGGWIGAPVPGAYRRKSVRMIAEGSVLVGSADGVWGSLVDVTPDAPVGHKVYRWGYAFPVGV